MVGRQRHDAKYWKGIIQDFLVSEMSQKDYVEEHKICRATLSAWGKRLGIPLSQRGRSPQNEEELSLSFIEVQPLERGQVSLKVEICFPQGHTLKLETEGSWEQAGAFIKAVVG